MKPGPLVARMPKRWLEAASVPRPKPSCAACSKRRHRGYTISKRDWLVKPCATLACRFPSRLPGARRRRSRRASASQPSDSSPSFSWTSAITTALTLRQAPDKLADQIASLYRWAEEEIRRHHGLVGRYEGDAIMATFNVTGVRLDHPVQALQAALAIREKAAFAGLPVGIGIAVGPAIVGQFSQGSPVTAVGETINLAARLQSEVHGGEILMSEETFRRTSGWLQSEEFLVNEELLTLKGFPQPVRAYRLAAATRSGSTRAS